MGESSAAGGDMQAFFVSLKALEPANNRHCTVNASGFGNEL